jgi:hypothetical protein
VVEQVALPSSVGGLCRPIHLFVECAPHFAVRPIGAPRHRLLPLHVSIQSVLQFRRRLRSTESWRQ